MSVKAARRCWCSACQWRSITVFAEVGRIEVAEWLPSKWLSQDGIKDDGLDVSRFPKSDYRVPEANQHVAKRRLVQELEVSR